MLRKVFEKLGEPMKGATLFQVQLLLSAIGNAIDENPDVEHITLPEIWEWLNDILGMQE